MASTPVRRPISLQIACRAAFLKAFLKAFKGLWSPQALGRSSLGAPSARSRESQRLCEFLLNQLHIRVRQSYDEREAEIRKQLMEIKDMDAARRIHQQIIS